MATTPSTATIHLQAPAAGSADPRKLNLFPGRALSEREFELLQAYVDDRVRPLAGVLQPGIRAGLGVQHEGAGAALHLHIRPGAGVGAGGRLVRVSSTLALSWTELAAQARDQADADTLRDGFYYLTVRPVVEQIEPPGQRQPGTRTEVDPLLARRHEVVALPGLQRLPHASPRWLAMAPARAANRVCVQALQHSPYDTTTGALPLALLAVQAGLPLWVDTVAGRYLAEPDAVCRTFLAHSVTAWQAWAQRPALPAQAQTEAQADTLTDAPADTLAAALGLDYLPAAGPFGLALMHDLASAQPGLAFAPGDLQIELAPVPASTVQDVIEAELPRGTVDLVHRRGDRIRLLLAIPDPDYRRDLLDLPGRDLALEDELYDRYATAHASWAAWRSQWQAIYGQLDLDGPNPAGTGASAEALRKARAPALVDLPAHPDAIRDRLVLLRQQALAPGQTLPEPYLGHDTQPHLRETTGVAVDTTSVGLLARQAALRKRIATLEADLATGYGLINEITDFLGLQRQHLDNLTVSFTALAGGVAGDGSGLNLTRWATTAALLPVVPSAAGSNS
ncbi:MAG: hypothetical protein RLZZ584_3029 [Pseudomonadota bacterium]